MSDYKINEWASALDASEFEPLGELKILKLIYFMKYYNMTLDNVIYSNQELYVFFMKERQQASRHYVIHKNGIEELFLYMPYLSELKKDLGIVSTEKKKSKPKTKATGKKKTEKEKKNKVKISLPDNVIDMFAYKKRAG